MRRFALTFAAILCMLPMAAQNVLFSGKVLEKDTKMPVGYATVVVKERGLWTVTDPDGKFEIRNLPKGKYNVEVSTLGYAPETRVIEFKGDLTGTVFHLASENLTLDGVVVTAKENTAGATTSRVIDRVALDHLQINNVTDISALLPGGSTTKDSRLTAGDVRFEIRSDGESSIDNSSFGTAVEVNGIRLSNNTSFSETKGASTRSIASSNIESVEVITGVPSVEYGDLTTGMVKINTRKGKTPFMFEAKTDPNTKLISASKGFALPGRGGVINVDLERAKSIHDLMSPYTTYTRNAANLIYSNTFAMSSQTPVKFSFSLAGNVGGMDSESDPDAVKDTYTKSRDNNIRAGIDLNWMVNKPWLTTLEFKSSFSASNDFSQTNADKSSAGMTSAIHGKEEGYFVSTLYSEDPNAAIILRPAGYWYELQYVDSRPVSWNSHLKATWVHNFGAMTNRIKAGVELHGEGNLGRGVYYEDESTAPTYRTDPYNEKPFMNTLSLYAEESATIPIGETSLLLTAGVRGEYTFIKNSVYGTVGSTTPRFNAKYTIVQPNKKKTIRGLSVRASWGMAAKLPSYQMLFPTPYYSDLPVFASTTDANGYAFYAYHIYPMQAYCNPDLKWQTNHQSEVGTEIDIKGTKISLSGYYNKTYNAYLGGSAAASRVYKPFQYNLTTSGVQESGIPAENRIFSIDRETGIVTVSDRTGAHEPVELGYATYKKFTYEYTTFNSNTPIVRKGVEWVVDFGKVKALSTSFRLDGSWYSYKGHVENVLPYYPSAVGIGGAPYAYLGYYASKQPGNASNGEQNSKLKTNLSIITHIPKVRMIVSARIESTLWRSSRYISEYSGGQVTYRVHATNDLRILSDDIYSSSGATATFPIFYSTVDDPDTMIPFMEKFNWARENDEVLYNQLAKLVRVSNVPYYYGTRSYTPYFSANISVTKELGDIASISFNANNFFNNQMKVRNRLTGVTETLLNSLYVPLFYYGMTLRLKI